VDCPEDVNTYVHRIGRTARYKQKGKSILFLDPSESKFCDKLKEVNIHVHKIVPNPRKQLTIKRSLAAFVSEDPQLKFTA